MINHKERFGQGTEPGPTGNTHIIPHVSPRLYVDPVQHGSVHNGMVSMVARPIVH